MADQLIPLLIIARTRPIACQQGADLAPHFAYTAILDLPQYSPSNVELLLSTLNPSPKGVVVGGGVSVDLQQEVIAVVERENAKRAEGETLKLVVIPVGIRERVGAEGLMRWLKEALGEKFGVEW
jgi:hypothetical protein